MRSRVLTAIGLIPFILGTLFCASPWPFLVLILLLLCFCAVELDDLLKLEFNLAIPVWAVAFPLGLGFAIRDLPGLTFIAPVLALTGSFCGFWGAYLRSKDGKSTLGAILAPLWVIAPLACLVLLHRQVPKHITWHLANSALMAILPVWSGDTAAIFAGKAFGKHPLAPAISPKKTVEGAIANLTACMVVAAPLGIWIGYPWWVACLCGLLAGVFGQLGDLFESYVKRQAGVKDSGNLLPGHGGMLDRMDSLLFTAPTVYALLAFFRLY